MSPPTARETAREAAREAAMEVDDRATPSALERFVFTVVHHPVTTTMVTLAVLLFGVIAATRLPVELLPDLSYPSVTIQTTYADAAPAEIEEQVTRPLEELVSAVPGVIHVESVSREGRSEVVLDFAWGTGMNRALADVREKLDRVALPQNAQRPIVLRYDPSQEPIVRLAVALGKDATLADLARARLELDKRVKRELEKIPGVAAAELHGAPLEEVRVSPDPARMQALGVTATDVVLAVQASNVNMPGGAITEAGDRFLLRTVREARDPEGLADVILRSQSGRELRLADIADIARVPVEPEEFVLLGQERAIEVAIYREGDANTVAVANAVLARANELELGPGRTLRVLQNRARFIEDAIEEVKSNTLFGGALAALVLLFFLRSLGPTLVIAQAIPISLLATFVGLAALDVSLNLMSLGGLALGVGMLVDNAIVVLEAIARAREAAGPHVDRRTTAARGTAEVGPSVIASTLTTVAVFLPIAFVEGVAGQLVRDLSYAVSLSITSSMIVSLTLVPVLMGLGGPAEATTSPVIGRSRAAKLVLVPLVLAWPLLFAARVSGKALHLLATPFYRAYDALESLYPLFLRKALAHPGLVVAATFALCTTSVGLVPHLGRALLPAVDQDESFVQITLPRGASLDRTTQAVETLIATLSADPDVTQCFARIGSLTSSHSASGSVLGHHLAQIDLRTRPRDENTPGQGDATSVEDRLRRAVLDRNPEPEAELRFGRPELFAFDAPLEILLWSEDLLAAARAGRELLTRLTEVSGLVDLAPDDVRGRPEVIVHFDRDRLARLALSPKAVSDAVRQSVQGDVATRLHAHDAQLDVRVQLPRVHRSNLEDVRAIVVGVKEGVPIRLDAVASVEHALGPSEIRRIDGRRGLRIGASVVGRDLGSAAADTQRHLAALTEPGVTAEVRGQAEEMDRSLSSLAFTGLLSLFLVYVVMASSFESLHHPMLIMSTVPLAAAGVLAACFVTQTPLSAMVGMGGIILAGIVVNNAIVLVHAISDRREPGRDLRASILEASRVRLRPILMTTITTILGLVPMVVSEGAAASLRHSLAITIVGGLGVSTLLTLLVIPCAYALAPGRIARATARTTDA